MSDKWANLRGKTGHVEIWYPRNTNTHNLGPSAIEVDLIDVRASDGLRIEYDFDRDGWRILQPARLSWDANDEVCDPGWQEAAFVQSWQFIEDDDDD